MSTFSKGKAVWLCRERNPRRPRDSGYIVFTGRAKPVRCPWGYGWVDWSAEDGAGEELCPAGFRRVFGHHPLRPGGGPLKVRLSLEVVDTEGSEA